MEGAYCARDHENEVAKYRNPSKFIFLFVQVIDKLKDKYGSEYTDENVCLSGTHTHSGPAGFHQYVLFEVTSLGYVKQTLDALVDGIVNVRPLLVFRLEHLSI